MLLAFENLFGYDFDSYALSGKKKIPYMIFEMFDSYRSIQP